MRKVRFIALAVFLLLAFPCLSWGEDSDFQVKEINVHVLRESESRPTLDSDFLEAHFINMGAADAILLRQGNDTLLVDSGNLSTWKVLTDYIDSLGLGELTYAFATHPHNDHICGFMGLLPRIPVNTFLLPAFYENYQDRIYDDFLNLIEKQEIPTRFVSSGDQIRLGDALITFFQWQNPEAYVNDRSVILTARFGRRSILLAADIENRGQQALALQYGQALKADILKMPHHGLAAYTREFHAAVQPQLLTFSNTRRRIQSNLTRASRLELDWMLTTNGTVIAVTDGGDEWLAWQLPPEKNK